MCDYRQTVSHIHEILMLQKLERSCKSIQLQACLDKVEAKEALAAKETREKQHLVATQVGSPHSALQVLHNHTKSQSVLLHTIA